MPDQDILKCMLKCLILFFNITITCVKYGRMCRPGIVVIRKFIAIAIALLMKAYELVTCIVLSLIIEADSV